MSLQKNARAAKRVLPGTRNERFRQREIVFQPRVAETLTVKKKAGNSRKGLEGAGLRISRHESASLRASIAIKVAGLHPDFFHRLRLDSAAPRRYPKRSVRQGFLRNRDIRAEF